MFSTPANRSRTNDELDGDTAGKRRFFAPDAQSAVGASLGGQTTVGWRRLGPIYSKRSAVGAHLPVNTYAWAQQRPQQQQLQPASQRAGLGCFIVSKYKVPRRYDSNARGTYFPRQTGSSQRGRGRGPTPSAAQTWRVSSRRQTIATLLIVGFGVFSNICTRTHPIFFRPGRLFVSFTTENAIGSKSEAQNLNRKRNSLM